MNNNHFHSIDQKKAPEVLNLLVEISKGDSNKYEYSNKYGILELDRTLHGPNHYPVNYCDVPQTWNKEDDDPLDAVVFCSGSLVPGILVKGKVIGVLEMFDNDEKDYKIICVAAKDPRYNQIDHVDELREFERKDLRTFFETYKYAQTGPGTVKVGKFLGPNEAYKLIKESMKAYEEKFDTDTSQTS